MNIVNKFLENKKNYDNFVNLQQILNFTDEYIKNLPNETYDNIIKRILKGGKRCILHVYHCEKDILNILIKKRLPHLLNKKLFDKLLECSIYNKQKFDWVKMLIDNGFIINNSHKQLLYDNGCEFIFEEMIKSNKINNLSILLEKSSINKQLNKQLIKLFFEINKTYIPTNDDFKYFLTSSFTDIDYYMNLMIKNNFIPNNETLNILSLNNHSEFIYEFLKKILDFPLNLTDDIIKKLNHNHKILQLFLEKGYTPNEKIYEFIIQNYYSQPHENIIYFNEIYDIYQIKPTINTLKHACLKLNKELFDFCLKNNVIPNIECMYNVCINIYNNKSSHTYNILPGHFIEKMVDMKIIIDEKCMLLALNHNNHCLIPKLLTYGAPITKSIIEEMFKYNYNHININFNDYGIMYDDYIYNLCHKYNICNQYYDKFISNKNIDIHLLELRKLCHDYYADIDKINKHMELTNTSIDKYCYDNLLYILSQLSHCSKNYPSILKYIDSSIKENKYKPDIISILRIKNNTVYYYEKYLLS
jgi:hypothetical protein